MKRTALLTAATVAMLMSTPVGTAFAQGTAYAATGATTTPAQTRMANMKAKRMAMIQAAWAKAAANLTTLQQKWVAGLTKQSTQVQAMATKMGVDSDADVTAAMSKVSDDITAVGAVQIPSAPASAKELAIARQALTKARNKTLKDMAVARRTIVRKAHLMMMQARMQKKTRTSK